MHEFRELKVRITSDTAGGFRTLAAGPTGEAEGTFAAPFSDFELGTLIGKVGRARQNARSGISPDLELVKGFGGKLFDALFHDRVRDLYHDSLTATRAQGKRLRITLSLKDVPQLMQIPWEYLYDEPNLLSIWAETSVVRYLDLFGGKDPLPVEPPLRILGMVSNPNDPELPPLDADAERHNVEAALAPLGDTVEVSWLTNATREELVRRFWKGPYHVFHYIGHGGFDEDRRNGVLFFESAKGGRDEVPAESLAMLLGDPSLRLVVLNSCEGARNSPDDPFTGVASKLVQQQIPAVVAMQFEITDRAAILFAWGLYGALAAGYPIDSALTEARRAILSIDDNELEWGTPVLFMRVPDGRIFDVSSDAALDTSSVTTPELPARPKRSFRRHASAVLGALSSHRRLSAGVGAVVVLAAFAFVFFALLKGSGENWTRVDAGASVLDGGGRQEIRDIAPLPQGRAVAVGLSGDTPAVWIFDGSDWSRNDLSNERGVMNGVVTTSGKFLAVGSQVDSWRQLDAVVWLRTRGGTWPSVCDICGGKGHQVAYAAVARRDGSFVVVGNDQRGTNFDAAVWRSLDGGESWQRVAEEDADLTGEHSQVMKAVVDVGDRLVAVGRDGTDAAVWTSTDSLDWQRVSDAALRAPISFLEMTSVARLGTRVVAVGREQQQGRRNEAATWISYDRGSSWRRGTGEFAARGQLMRQVAVVPPGLVAVGLDHAAGKRAGPAVWSSRDGKTWTAVRSSAFVSKDFTMTSVVRVGNGTLFGAGGNGEDAAIWESHDR
jgi:hypothetical protein